MIDEAMSIIRNNTTAKASLIADTAPNAAKITMEIRNNPKINSKHFIVKIIQKVEYGEFTLYSFCLLFLSITNLPFHLSSLLNKFELNACKREVKIISPEISIFILLFF